MAWVYLDDQFPEHPKVIEAGGDAAWLYVCGLSYVKRQNTRGRIPKAVVGRISDRKAPSKLAGVLVRVGLWDELDDAFTIHDYDEWNRSSDARSEAGRKAAQARWANANGNANASGSQSDESSDGTDSADTSDVPNDAHSLSPPFPSDSSQSSTNVGCEPASTDDDRIRLAAELLAVGDLARLREDKPEHRIGDEARWLEATARRRLNIDGEALAQLAAAHPDWPPSQLCDEFVKPTPKATPLDGMAAAQAERIERAQRRAEGIFDCALCEDSGVVEEEDGTYADCDCKYRKVS